MSKITYADKVALNLNAGIPDANKVKDTDMNDIKGAVNQIGAYNTAVAVTNGDFKTTLVGTLDTNDIILVSFPNATNGTSNARISIDNGVTYKNIVDFVGKNVVASNIQASKRRLLYNGTSFVLDDVDYGSNSNGSYTRYKDGTMICTRSIDKEMSCNNSWGSLFYGYDSTVYKFAQEFISAPKLFLTAFQRLNSSFWLSNYYNTIVNKDSFYNYSIMRATSADTVALTLNVLAIGRWK